jgi:signal transduction histidine kinase
VVEVNPVQQDIQPLIEEVICGVQSKTKQKEICISYEINGEQMACFDLKWTKEALGNILDNAVKYSPSGSIVTIGSAEYELYTDIWVKDQGIGIAEEEIPKIFGRFYRSEDVQQEDGVGIGLFLAREIIGRQDGYIKVESKPGRGTTFHMFLRRNL